MLRNSIFQIMANVFSAALNLLIIVFTSRNLGALGRGEITYLIICLGILQIFTSIVGNSVMIYMLTKHTKQDVLLSSLIWTLFSIFIAIPALFFLTTLSVKSLGYLVILCILQTSFSNLIAFYSSELKFKLITLLKTVQPIFFLLLVAIYYPIQKFTVNLYWIFLIISFVPHFVIFLVELYKSTHLVKWQNIKLTILDFLKLGGLGQFTNLMQYGSYKFAALIVAQVLNFKQVGVFGLWLTVVDAVWLIPMGLATVNMSYATKSDYDFKTIYKYLLVALSIAFSLLTIILIVPNRVFTWVLGPEFFELKTLILISSPVIMAFTINIIIGNYFSAKGLIKYNTISSGLGFIAIILFTGFLTENYGLKGAVLSNCLSYTLSIITTIYLFRRNIKQLNHIQF